MGENWDLGFSILAVDVCSVPCESYFSGLSVNVSLTIGRVVHHSVEVLSKV